jgi:tetratricopeptide (TPR) repeat protein
MNKRIHKNVNHPDIATSLNNIGVVYFSLREFHKALDYYERSLRMKQVFFDSTNPQIILLQQRIKNLKLLRLVYFVIS